MLANSLACLLLLLSHFSGSAARHVAYGQAHDYLLLHRALRRHVGSAASTNVSDAAPSASSTPSSADIQTNDAWNDEIDLSQPPPANLTESLMDIQADKQWCADKGCLWWGSVAVIVVFGVAIWACQARKATAEYNRAVVARFFTSGSSATPEDYAEMPDKLKSAWLKNAPAEIKADYAKLQAAGFVAQPLPQCLSSIDAWVKNPKYDPTAEVPRQLKVNWLALDPAEQAKIKAANLPVNFGDFNTYNMRQDFAHANLEGVAWQRDVQSPTQDAIWKPPPNPVVPAPRQPAASDSDSIDLSGSSLSDVDEDIAGAQYAPRDEYEFVPGASYPYNADQIIWYNKFIQWLVSTESRPFQYASDTGDNFDAIQSACADFLDLPSSKETLFPEDGDQIFNRVSAGAADGIIGQDIDKVYSSKNPGWKAGTSITKARPTVLGFEEFVAQEHPEGFSNFRDSAASQFEAWETEYLQREAFDGTPTGTVALFRTALEGYEKCVAADVNRKLGTTGNFFTDRNGNKIVPATNNAPSRNAPPETQPRTDTVVSDGTVPTRQVPQSGGPATSMAQDYAKWQADRLTTQYASWVAQHGPALPADSEGIETIVKDQANIDAFFSAVKTKQPANFETALGSRLGTGLFKELLEQAQAACGSAKLTRRAMDAICNFAQDDSIQPADGDAVGDTDGTDKLPTDGDAGSVAAAKGPASASLADQIKGVLQGQGQCNLKG